MDNYNAVVKVDYDIDGELSRAKAWEMLESGGLELRKVKPINGKPYYVAFHEAFTISRRKAK